MDQDSQINVNAIVEELNSYSNLTANQKELREKFIDLQDEFEDVNCKENCNELVSDLEKIRNGLKDFSVVGRILTEIRRLKQRSSGLRSKSDIEAEQKEADFYRAAPDCPNPRCDKKMVIRLRNDNKQPFWGCNRFGCKGTLSLTDEELKSYTDI
tara:strand:+ start:84 stop:548 length:465 start_codon:yes stop_codon:yes gene_type:complete